MQKLISQPMMAIIAITASIGIGTPANAYSISFAEDLGLGESTRLPSRPNADAARSEFLSNLVGVGTETFESLSPGSNPPLSINFPGAGTATLQGAGSIDNVPTGTNGVGRYPISGNQYYETGSGNFSIAFSQPVAAFGFYGVDIGDFSGQITLSLVNNSTTTLTVPSTVNGPGGSVLYYGLIAQNPNEIFTNITFGNTSSGSDFFAFDDLTIGSLEQVVTPEPVPEPSSVLGTLVFGALGIGSVLKRKLKRKQTQQA